MRKNFETISNVAGICAGIAVKEFVEDRMDVLSLMDGLVIKMGYKLVSITAGYEVGMHVRKTCNDILSRVEKVVDRL